MSTVDSRDFVSKAVQGAISEAFAKKGAALPASIVSVDGGTATIQFETGDDIPNVVVPVAGTKYQIAPLVRGDKGVVIPIDALLGGHAGLGDGTPKAGVRGLESLVFIPTGEKRNKPKSDESGAHVIIGDTDVVLRNGSLQMSLKRSQKWEQWLMEQLNALAASRATVSGGPTAPVIITPFTETNLIKPL